MGDKHGHDRRFARRRDYWCGSWLASRPIGARDRVRSAWRHSYWHFRRAHRVRAVPEPWAARDGGILAAIIAATLGAVILLLIVRLIGQASA